MENEETQEDKKLTITLSKGLYDKVLEDKEEPSNYVEELIRQDYAQDSPQETSKETAASEPKRGLNEEEKEQAKEEFLKRFRDDEWIEYMAETRGKESVMKEADRLTKKNEKEWRDFLRDFETEG